MPLPDFEKISGLELKLFLDDIRKNIEYDEDADFKKLVLYLFGFTHTKIRITLQRSGNDPELELLEFLIDTIILVLTKRKSLLLIEITEEDSLETVPELDERYIDFAKAPFVLYEWALSVFLMHLRTGYSHNSVVNLLKTFLIDLITLVATNLHNFRHRKQVRVFLLGILDNAVNQVFEEACQRNISTSPDWNEVAPKMAFSVQYFSILYDYDLSSRLLTHNSGVELKLESYARKLTFSANMVDLGLLAKDIHSFSLFDRLKSLLLLTLTNNLFTRNSVSWCSMSLVLGWIAEYIQSFYNIHQSFSKVHLTSFDKICCMSLLRIFQFCIENDCIGLFGKCFRLEPFMRSHLTGLGYLPPMILTTLRILNYYVEPEFDSSGLRQEHEIEKLNLGSFNSYELNAIKYEIEEKLSSIGKNRSPSEVLDLGLINIGSLKELRKQLDNMDYFVWIKSVNLLTLPSDGRADTVFDDTSHLYTLIAKIQFFPCLIGGTYDFKINECLTCYRTSLSVCNYEAISQHRKNIIDQPEIAFYYKNIITDFLLNKKANVINSEPLLCIAVLLAIFRLLASYRISLKDRGNDDLIFNFIMGCLEKNKNRDVRLRAAMILPLFLLSPRDETLDKTFGLVFRRLTDIRFDGQSGKTYLAESTIRAFGELAIVAEGEWLCVIFIKLVDFLGEPNEHHVNLVYSEFLNVAIAKKKTTYKLLSPFLPTIAERVVKQPRILQKITDLLGVTKKYFLNRTKEYTTPRFLEYYKYDFIQEIAEAAGVSKWKLIAKYLPRIMATYLCKSNTINEEYIINVLSNASPEYKNVTVEDLVSSIGEITWFVLLQIQVDADGNFLNESNITNALIFISKISLLKSGHSLPKNEKSFDFILYLLGEHVLELVQRFSENVHQLRGSKPFLEKLSSLKAIEFFVSKNSTAAVSALGQISTCLQAALDNPEFELPAIRCWNVLIQNLLTDHSMSMFDIIISLIFQKFNALEHRSKIVAVGILKKLFLDIKDSYSHYTLYYFSIPFIKNLDNYYRFDAILRTQIKPGSKIGFLQEFTRRLDTGNKYVVKQALTDLINYTTKYQIRCQSEDFKDPSAEEAISELLRTLTDTGSKFRNLDSLVSTACAKVLAITGALDPNKFNLKRVKSQIIVLHDFREYQENARFLQHFMETRLIKLFWASGDPVKQLFSAYSMQNFLEILGLRSDILRGVGDDTHLETWNDFSDIAKSTLTPFLSSKYVSPILKYEPIRYPYYRIGTTHEKWLVDFTSDLLRRPLCVPFDENNKTKKDIFQTCSVLVRNRDISICQYLLKYVALSHVVNGEELVIKNIKDEFLHMLHINASMPSDCSEHLKLCYQSIFDVLDYFHEWVSAAIHSLNEDPLSKTVANKLKQNLAYVNSFLENIPTETIVLKSAECDSYERTILYLEKCFREGGENISFITENINIVSTLQSMYASINDYDSLAGILKKFSTNNLSEKLSTFQYNEDWALAQESFQVLSEKGPPESKIENSTKLLRSLSDNALYNEVLSNLATKVDFEDLANVPLDWSMVGLQAALVASDETEIKKWLFIIDSIGTSQGVETLTNYEVANGIKFLFDSNEQRFDKSMENNYRTIGSSLVSSMSSSVSRNNSLMIHLHSMYDLSLIVSNCSQSDNFILEETLSILEERLANTEQSFGTQWKIRAMHRIAFTILNKRLHISRNLLCCSQIARKSNRLDVAARCIMQAMALNDNGANIDYAELLWAQGRQTEAIKSIAEVLSEDKLLDKKESARVQLQYAEWLDESNHSSSATIIAEYMKAYKLDGSWEKPYYELGKYYNKLMGTQVELSGIYEQHTIRFFLKALSSGPSFIFEALPKLITIWLDFAQNARKESKAGRLLNQMVLDIESYIDIIPIYVWYASITQILSRINHNHLESYQLLSRIVYKLIQAYPKHSLWYVLSHLNSNDNLRKLRIASILKKVQSSSELLARTLGKARELFSSLILIANFKIQRRSVKTLSLREDFHVKNLTSPNTALVIPVNSNLEVSLPAKRHMKNPSYAFPKSSSITAENFEDKVNIFHSLQMPRQLSVRGSDGLKYQLMIKKDDTRKDAKVIEFTNMVNRLLSVSTAARKRNLYIANYSVIPLAENMGVIEFVNGVTTMKAIINDERRKVGRNVNDRKLFMKLDEAQKALKNNPADDNTLAHLVNVFKKICLESPAVLYNWFVNQFTDPRSWYLARISYTRTAAVMSIVGYIIGLGDRHCENILFFKSSGGILHIDFDCLFEKGKTLPTPEIVPFRLTQNLVDAMGVSGIEGSFRISAEVTATILRGNEASLMNILETLIYDPLLDWKTQQNPQEHLRKVRRKIRGLIEENECLPMNVHGHVDVLIQEASSQERLSQMYGGWAPYI